MVRVITYETSRKEWDKSLLQYICKRNSFELDVLGQHEEWNGTKQKIFAYLEHLKGLDPDELVICCDNRDVIIPSKPEEIIDKFNSMSGICYYSAELGSFPIWAMEKHFPDAVENKYRPEVRVLNSGVCIGPANVLVKVFEYASMFYHPSFDMREYLRSKYRISDSHIEAADKNYGFVGNSWECDQLALQLTYLERPDLITLDYDYDLISTSFVLDDKWIPAKNWREYSRPDYPYGTLYDMKFDWGNSYRCVYNTYTGSYPLIYHSPGPDYVMYQLRKVVRGSDFRSRIDELAKKRNAVSKLRSVSMMEDFIAANKDKKKFVCYKIQRLKNKETGKYEKTPPLFDAFDLCLKHDKVLVVLSARVNSYTDDLEYMLATSSSNVFIYEVSKYGNRNAIRAKMRGYVKQFDDAIAIPEDLFIDVDISLGGTGKVNSKLDAKPDVKPDIEPDDGPLDEFFE